MASTCAASCSSQLRKSASPPSTVRPMEQAGAGFRNPAPCNGFRAHRGEEYDKNARLDEFSLKEAIIEQFELLFFSLDKGSSLGRGLSWHGSSRNRREGSDFYSRHSQTDTLYQHDTLCCEHRWRTSASRSTAILYLADIRLPMTLEVVD